MVGFFIRLAAAAALSISLTACGGGSSLPDNVASAGNADNSVEPSQCVPYARAQSGINIYGDAYTWWNQAEGRFEKRSTPLNGAVLVLANYAGPTSAHLAVVRSIDSARTIRVDHANWFNDGQVYVDDPVIDVSPNNDWSQVRVFNIRNQAWGTKIYPVQGFITPNNPTGPSPAPKRIDPIAALLLADRTGE
jgi:surface antigen